MKINIFCLFIILIHQGIICLASEIPDSSKTSAIESTTSYPNILILFADDLGYGDLAGISAHPTSHTPNLNRLAKRSKVFTNFYVSSPVCSPSRSSLLTGKYQVQTGIYPGVFNADSNGGLTLEHETIAQKLYEKGYATAHVGKWHLGVGINKEYLPTVHGFERYCGIPYSHDMCPCHICFPNNGQCNTHCRNELVSCPVIETEMSSNASGNTQGTFNILQQPADLPTLTNLYTEKAMEYMENSISANKPFFLYMAYHQTHHPQFSGAEFHQKSERGPFGEALEEMDDSIGKLLDFIDQSGKREDTMVIFSSDNGPLIHDDKGDFSGCAGPLRCGKGTTWEGGQRVPGIISYPGKIKPGRSHALTSILDIMPTIMSMVGEDVPKDGVSYDLSDLLFNEGEGPRDVFLYYGKNPSQNDGVYAVRYKDYKAHFITQGNDLSGANNYDHECRGDAGKKKYDPPLLYNINKDPTERFSLDNSTDFYQEIMSKLLKAKQVEEAKVGQWAPSSVHKGSSREAEICCNPAGTSCEPFPECCDCEP